MTAFAFGHIALIAIGVSIAVARVVAWLLDRRAHTANAQIREQAFVTQASADLAATGWTAHHESLYQAEIEASRRGDFIAAARFAEQQEAVNG
ncbi:hypothetical protein [Stenotrophomonas sp.]|uniref:hypothetical protein n=1 Tax=Stenotrophomonas sp. TaxID=69392 RepID=UPI0028AAE679|nr:hypothetical protein [Stenotrophomonas sp.]